MKKLLMVFFLLIATGLYASSDEHNLATLTVIKKGLKTQSDWIVINKKAIAKLITNQKKIEQQIELLKKQYNNKYLVKTYYANVRAKPDINSKIKGVLKQGTVVYIKHFVNGIWGQIDNNSYISKTVLTKLK